MKFIEFLKNFFQENEQYEEISQTLACLNSIVPMPKREDFLDNKSKLDLIELYKTEYLKLLKQNKTITSIDVMPKEIHQYKNIYTDLLLRLCVEDNSDISFELIKDTENYENEQLDITITCMKLMLYQQEVSLLEEKARIRLIALNEILENLLNEKLFTKMKSKEIINSLLCEINNLHSALVVFINQKNAMKIESENYLKNLSLPYNIETIDIDDNLIMERLEELKHILNVIAPEELKRLESMNLNSKLFIAIIEQRLEIYVYTHPQTLEALKEKVRDIGCEVHHKANYYFTDEKIRFWDVKNEVQKRKYEYLSKIEEIELLYKVFSKYGRNLVSKEDLSSLYEVKFKLLTCDILDEEQFDILSSVTFTELECYQNIVFQKIEKILKGENDWIQQLYYINPFGESVNIIKDITAILKNGEKDFSIWTILNDKTLLSFVLAFEEEDGLMRFFHKIRVPKEEYSNINYYSAFFEWEDMLPLDTIFRLVKCNLETKTYNCLIDGPMYRLYLINSISQKNTHYIMPEGLKKVRIPFNISGLLSTGILGIGIERKDDLVINYIRNKARNKNVILPKSLKSMAGNLFDITAVKEVILNENLEELGDYALFIPLLERITFLNPLMHISSKALVFSQLKEITIQNYLEDTALEDFGKLLCECYKAIATNKIRTYKIPGLNEHLSSSFDENETEEYHSPSYYSYLLNHDLIYRTYRLIPSFDKLTIVNRYGKSVIFTKEDVTFEKERDYYFDFYRKEDNKDKKINLDERRYIMDKLKDTFDTAFKQLEESSQLVKK